MTFTPYPICKPTSTKANDRISAPLLWELIDRIDVYEVTETGW